MVGAHPTGGIVANQTSIEAQQEEYPFVLLECRGVDSALRRQRIAAQPGDMLDTGLERAVPGQVPDQYPPYRLDQFATTGRTGPGRRRPVPLPESLQVSAGAHPALGALRRRRRGGLLRRAGRVRRRAAGIAELRRLGAPEQRDLRCHRPRRQGISRLRRVDLRRERLARLLANGALLARRPCPSWASAATRKRSPCPGGPSLLSEEAADACEAKGAFAPGRARQPAGRRRPHRQREPLVDAVELAQPDQRAPDLATPPVSATS